MSLLSVSHLTMQFGGLVAVMISTWSWNRGGLPG